jgi:hypothetical protein
LVAADGKDPKEGEAVLIPVILTSKAQGRVTKIWIKAMPKKNLDENILAYSQDHEFIESLLKKALEEVQSEEKPSHSVENQTGQIEITLDTLLCMSEDEKQVRMMNLSTK